MKKNRRNLKAGIYIAVKRLRQGTAFIVSLCMLLLLLLPWAGTVAKAEEKSPEGENFREITLAVGEEKTITDFSGNYSGTDLSGLDNTVAAVTVNGQDESVTKADVPENGRSYLIGDGRGHYLKLEDGALSETEDPYLASEWTISLSSGNNIRNIVHNGYYLSWSGGVLKAVRENSDAVWLCEGGMIYVQSSTTGRYTLACDEDGWKLIQTAYGTEAEGNLGAAYTAVPASTDITFRGVKEGSTSVMIGGTLYQITVTGEVSDLLDVGLAVTARYTSNRLSWEADGITEYTVEYSEDGNEYLELGTTEEGSFIHDTGAAGTRYYYRVESGGKTSHEVRADYATGLEALEASSVASWGFSGEEKEFDGNRREILAESGSRTAEALNAMPEGTVLIRTMSEVRSGMTAAVGSSGMFWAGSQNANFRIEINSSLMKAYLPGTEIQVGSSRTSAFSFDSDTLHWALSANGIAAGGTLKGPSGFLNSSGAEEYYIGGTDSDSVSGFKGKISYVLITGETLSDDELNALTGDNPALPDEETELGSAMYQMFRTDNTAKSENSSNTWMFDGGRTTAGHFTDIGGARSYVYQFEEYIRWHQASGSTNWSGRQRYVFNTGKSGQSLADSLEAFDSRAQELDPRAAVYLVGAEDYDAGAEGIESFKEELREYIEKGLALRGGKGYVLIQTPVPADGEDENVSLYAQAVREVLDSLDNSRKPRVQIVDHAAQKWEEECFNPDGSLNARGHLEMGRQICESLLGSADGYPDSNISTDFPNLEVEEAPEIHLSEAASVTAGTDSLTVQIPEEAVSTESWLCTVETDSYDLTVLKEGSSFEIGNLPSGEDYVLTLTASDWSIQLPVMSGTLRDGEKGEVRERALDENQQAVKDLTENEEPLTWLFMGDSITHGALHLGGYDSITQTFEKYLKDDLGREDDIVINTAVSSAGVTDTLTYIYERLDRYDPYVVSIMLGTNNRSNTQDYAEKLQEVIDAAEAKGARVILRIPIPNQGNNDSGLAEIRDLALQTAENNQDVIVIDQYTVFSGLMDKAPYLGGLLYNDNLHPKAPGQLLMSRLFIEGTGLSLDNTYIGSLAYDLATSDETAEEEISAEWGENSISLDVDALAEEQGEKFFSVTLRAEDADGRVYSVSGESGTLTLANLPEGDYSAVAEAVLGSRNVCVTYPILPRQAAVLSETERTLVEGSSFTLTAEGGEEFEWTSSDESVAVVDGGKVTALGEGTAVITAENTDGESASCIVTVVKAVLKAGFDQGPSGTVEDQPFASGTGGSYYFRIPSLITLENGWLMAAADARYNTTGDGGGLDTIVSISKDGGETWEYSFPIYFPDSDGYVGRAATTIIDPVLIQGEDGKVYLMADVNPTGMTTLYATPGRGNGHILINGQERLALTSEYSRSDTVPTEEDVETYEYYVGDFENGYAPVFSRRTGEASRYAVDQWYNLYETADGEYTALVQRQVDAEGNQTGEFVQQNVFYKDSELHVFRTGYMWLLSSDDNGASWSCTDITAQIKRDSETGLLVSPGKGTLLEDGTIVIPFYNHYDTESSSGMERASFIYSSDNGKTWKRTGDVPDNHGFSSESEIIELPDGTLRMFFRNGSGQICYADARQEDGEYRWSSAETTGVSVCSTCNISASVYSGKIDGKTAVLVSCPGNAAARRDGRIFTFLVDDNGEMTLAYTFAVDSPGPNQYYEYSCLTELQDGTVGLLYEYNSGRIMYETFDITEIADGALIDGKRVVNVPLYGTVTQKAAGTFSVGAVVPEGIVSVETEERKEALAERGTDSSYSGEKTFLSDALYSFTANGDGTYVIESVHSPGVYLNHLSGNAGYPGAGTPADVNLTWGSDGQVGFWLPSEGLYSYLYFHSDASKLRFDRARYDHAGINENCEFVLYRPAEEDEESSEEIAGYVKVTGEEDFSAGGNYLIAAQRGDDYYVLYPSTDSGSYYAHAAKVGEKENVTLVSYTGQKEGTASFTEKKTGIEYEVRVEAEKMVEISVEEGKTVIIPSHASEEDITRKPEMETAELSFGEADQSFTVNGSQGSLAGTETPSDFDGEQVPLSNALYRIEKADSGGYIVYSETADGRIYLNIRGGDAVAPGGADPAVIRFSDLGNAAFQVEEISGTQNGSILYFHDTPVTSNGVTNYLNFNRNGIPDGTRTSFALYRPAGEGEDSPEIQGYVRIQSGDEIKDGGFYMITAEVDGSRYALYPSLSADKYDHVIKVDPDSERIETTVANRFPAMTVRGIREGVTDACIDGTVYRISVTGEEQPPQEAVSTTVLEYALSLAETADTEGTVESVVKMFNDARAAAEEILARAQEGDPSLTQEMVDVSWQKLIKAMQYLSFKQGDKTDLQKVIDMAKSLDLSKYLDEGQQEFTDALAAAEAVLANGDAMQDEVDQSWKDLLKAMSDLRLKPNKETLKDLIDEADTVSTEGVDDETIAGFRNALAMAKSVYDNEQATEEEVVTAEEDLQAALDQLRAAERGTDQSGDDSNISSGGNAQDQKTQNGGSTNGNNADASGKDNASDRKDTIRNNSVQKSVKTGDTVAPIAGMAAVVILAAAAGILAYRWRRKTR